MNCLFQCGTFEVLCFIQDFNYIFDNDGSFSRFPFDTKNLIVYLIAVSLQYLLIALNFCYAASTLSLGIGSYLFMNSTIENNKGILISINRIAQAKKSRSQMLKQLSKFIKFHSISKKLNLTKALIFNKFIIGFYSFSDLFVIFRLFFN